MRQIGRMLGDKVIIGAILALFALNVLVDSVLYFVSVAIDGLTLGVAVWLGFKLISHYNAKLREKDRAIAELQNAPTWRSGMFEQSTARVRSRSL